MTHATLSFAHDTSIDTAATITSGAAPLARLAIFAQFMNPRRKDLSAECPQLNAAPLFGAEGYMKIGFPDLHPSVSVWGHDTYITGWVVIGEDSAIYPGCNFNGDALMPLVIGKRVSLQHVELHYSGFRMLPTIIGDDTFMSHLGFGHSVKIGKGCYILGHVAMYDGAEIGDNVFIDGNSTILGSARLKSGWAYEGRVDRDTKPRSRTSEVVFGIDPKTGETLYIGGEEGVADIVNRSHLSRNDNQMRLVALKQGYPEKLAPAYAVVITHVYQTATHYLTLASQILMQIGAELHQTRDLGTAAELAALANDCQSLAASIRVIHDGDPIEQRLSEAWSRRTAIVERVIETIDAAEGPYLISLPVLLDKPIIQEKSELQTMTRKLREFEEVMQSWEQKCPELDS